MVLGGSAGQIMLSNACPPRRQSPAVATRLARASAILDDVVENERRHDVPNGVIGVVDGLFRAGDVRVRLPGRELLICATLGLHGRPLSIEALIDVVWPDFDAGRARGMLRVYGHRIRRRLGRPDAIVSSADRWTLGPGLALDITLWDRLADEARTAGAEAHRGELERAFAALLTGAVPSLARSALAAGLEGAMGDVLHRIGGVLIDDAFARGDFADAIALARAAAATDPYDERWQEAQIRAYLGMGDPFAAHRALRAFRDRLASDLGASVSPGLAELCAARTRLA